MLLAPADEVSVGDVTPARGRTVTETDVVSFCYLTGNWLEIHSNTELASRTEYGQRVVQGSLVFSMVPGLVSWDPRYTRAFYGVDSLRFVRPVFIGDTITARIRVADKEDRDADSAVVTFAVEVVNQRDEVVQVCRMRILGRRRALEGVDARG
ncbi:MaoC/PaaZ C-terminal domain-containing protein [Actinomadura sp. 1N219]|uniref:MaoC/PaaZ C-terminal domain-containing protein n=1 Tax=Actinomadura sp. 1N219 TaxID=3375152 RepID=UPI0037895952